MCGCPRDLRMKKVYESMSFHQVGFRQSILQQAGIDCSIRNANGAGLVGEIPFTEVYPELWVTADEDAARALEILAAQNAALTAPVELADWVCGQCGELVPGNFETCWNCGAEPPTQEPS
jgi:hypothetical protein